MQERLDNQSNDLLRDRLYNVEVPPPPAAWTNIESELDRRRRRRRRPLAWLIWAGGFMLFSLMGYYNWPNTVAAVLPKAPSKPQEPIATVLESQYTANTSSLSSTPEEVAPTAAPSERLLTQAHHLAKAVAIVPTSSREVASPAPAVINETKDSDNVQVASVPTAAQVGTETVAETTTSEPLETVNATKGAFTAWPSVSPLQAEFTENKVTSLTKAEEVPNLTLDVLPTKRKRDQYHFDHRAAFLLMDVYGGIEGTGKRLTALNTGSASYKQRRDETESLSWAFNGGVQATLLWGQHWRLSTGAHYEQVTEVFRYTDPAAVEYIVTERQPIDTIGRITGKRNILNYNRLGMLDMPVTVGYELRKGRWGMNLNAGPSFNMWFWNRATLLTDEKTVSDLQAKNIDLFEKRTGMSWMVNAQAFYHIRPSWRVFVAPYWRKQMRDVTNADYGIGQRYTMQGVQVGLTRIFH